MLGDPARYRFVARVHRTDNAGNPVIDADPLITTWADLAISPLSAVMLAEGVAAQRLADRAQTGFRSVVASALIAKLADAGNVTGLDIAPASDDAASLGLAHFEAIAMTLKALLDKSRFATRKDLVRVDDKIEATLPSMGEYPGVDVDEIVGRADALAGEFDAASAAVLASAGADALLAALDAMTDLLPQASWPAQVFAIDADGADPATRDARAADAIATLKPILDAIGDAVHADPPLHVGQAAPTDAQRAQHAMDRLRRLFGKDFPVLPKFALGAYATEFNASLAEQDALTVTDPWRINGWLTQVGRVREGADRFAAAVSAHEALCAPLALGDLKLVQFPHRAGQIWAALPQAWLEKEGSAFDPKDVPEELRDYLAARPGTPYRDIQRAAPSLAIALHAPGLRGDRRRADDRGVRVRRLARVHPRPVPDGGHRLSLRRAGRAAAADDPARVAAEARPGGVEFRRRRRRDPRGLRPRQTARRASARPGGRPGCGPARQLPAAQLHRRPAERARARTVARSAQQGNIRGQSHREIHARQDLNARDQAVRYEFNKTAASLNFVGVRTPSITGITRLETQPTAINLQAGLAAPLADPLWLLSRQWQFNEFQGEDAGTPLRLAFQVQGVKVDAFRAGTDPAAAWQPIVDHDVPIETRVEAEPAWSTHPRLRGEAGLHALRMASAPVRAALLAAYPFALAAPTDADADRAGLLWSTLLDARTIDASALAAELRPLLDGSGKLGGLPARVALGGADADDAKTMLGKWIAWLDTVLYEGDAAQPSWQRNRMEYAFALKAGDTQLDAAEYTDGHLDWEDFQATAAAPAEEPVRQTFAVASRHPTPVRYPGMPAERYWEFEDGDVNFAGAEAGVTDLLRMSVTEFALTFGNDWFLVPVRLPVGWIHRVSDFVITDSFGVASSANAIVNPDGTQWSMYSMTADVTLQGRLQHALFLPDSLDGVQEGAVLEETMLARDEMANLAWAIEHTVQGVSGEPLDRELEAKALAFQQRIAFDGGVDSPQLVYRLQTPVPANWTPLLPVRDTPFNPCRSAYDSPRAGRHEALLPRGQHRGGRRGRSCVCRLPRAARCADRLHHACRHRRRPARLCVLSARLDAAPRPAAPDGRRRHAADRGRRSAAHRRHAQAQVPVRAKQRRPQLAVGRSQQDGGTRRGAKRFALRRGCEARDAALTRACRRRRKGWGHIFCVLVGLLPRRAAPLVRTA